MTELHSLNLKFMLTLIKTCYFAVLCIKHGLVLIV